MQMFEINKKVKFKLDESEDMPLYETFGLRKMDSEYIWHHVRSVRKHNTQNIAERIDELFTRFKGAELVYALIVLGKTEMDKSWQERRS